MWGVQVLKSISISQKMFKWKRKKKFEKEFVMKKKFKEMLNGKFWKENVGTKSAGESTPGLQLYLERDFKTDAFLNFAKFLRRTPPGNCFFIFLQYFLNILPVQVTFYNGYIQIHSNSADIHNMIAFRE